MYLQDVFKMARSYSKRKSKTKKPPTDVVDLVKTQINNTVEYVRQWQKKELSKLAYNNNNPICVSVGNNKYIVGRFGIAAHNGIWFSVDTRNDNEHHFAFKTSAVLHALCDLKGMTKLSYEIRKYDNEVLKISNDIHIYQHRMNTALKAGDYWRVDYFTTLRDTAQYKLEESKKRLQKSIDLAKYFKIWMS